MAFSRWHQWMDRGGRPNAMARAINRLTALVHSSGVSRDYLVTLEVVGRKSGKIISFPLAMAVVDGKRYLVSMLGPEANWVQNLKAAGWDATLRHGITERICLHEIPVSERPPILKAYLKIAPGARPHIPVSVDAPLTEFEAVAVDYPVFRVETMDGP
ncbi:MAG TPA: nitroreductase/quinone reductase family protein [Promineifilum sp.]|nr:nitroreductase/quinone reductase family protein [Promineifilum sp.]